MLSVEPWLVERGGRRPDSWPGYSFSALSRAVVGGTVCNGWRRRYYWCFSALSRAVVGGTVENERATVTIAGFSALSRAVVGGTV